MAEQSHMQPVPPEGMRLGMGYMSALNEPCYELYAENEFIPQAQALCLRQGSWTAVPGIYMAVPSGSPFSHSAALASAAIQASPGAAPQMPRPGNLTAQAADYESVFAQSAIVEAPPVQSKPVMRFAGLSDDDGFGSSKAGRKTSSFNDTEAPKETQPLAAAAQKKQVIPPPYKNTEETLVAYAATVPVQSDAPRGVLTHKPESPIGGSVPKLQTTSAAKGTSLSALPELASSLEKTGRVAAGKTMKAASFSEELIVSFAGRLADINLLSSSKGKESVLNKTEMQYSVPQKSDESLITIAPKPASTERAVASVQKNDTVKNAPAKASKKEKRKPPMKRLAARASKPSLKNWKNNLALGSYADLLTKANGTKSKNPASK